MKYLRFISVFLFIVVFSAGCATNKWYKDWRICSAAGAATGAIAVGSTAEDTGGYGVLAGGVGGAILGGVICKLLGKEADSDGDGVPDKLDKCPDTPSGVKVDKDGCPIDSDGDGVPDYLDKCPDTKSGVKVDDKGCPVDSDGDGVPDYLDKCPNTPSGVKVDDKGCPIDSDCDGVPDYLDKCPDTPCNVKVDESGCPLKEKIVLQGINFDFDSYKIREDAKKILDVAVMVLKKNPNIRVRIEGHTDSIGTKEYNLVLSKKRAEATKEYLVSHGIDASRIETVGKGEDYPVASNKTKEGRAKNRRIEFIILQ